MSSSIYYVELLISVMLNFVIIELYHKTWPVEANRSKIRKKVTLFFLFIMG